MKKNVRYNIKKSFEENKKEWPYGYKDIEDVNQKIDKYLKDFDKVYDFFWYKTKLPIWVAAWSLFNRRYMKAAAKDGFTVITWKTFRSEFRLAHKNNWNFLGHNIVFLHKDKQLTENDILKEVTVDLNLPDNVENISITNSFWMWSDEPWIWSKKAQEIEEWMKKHNKQTIASVVGSPKNDWTIEMLAEDYANVAKISEDCWAKIIELNFSCPNVSNNSCWKEGSIYNSPEDAKIICKIVREKLNKDTKLLIKVWYSEKKDYKILLNTVKDYIDWVVAINTIPMKVLDWKWKQALPWWLISWIWWKNILSLATEAVKRLKEVKEEEWLNIKIIWCWWVTNSEWFFRHLDAWAEFVMCATAALFNPELPLQIAKEIKDKNKLEYS